MARTFAFPAPAASGLRKSLGRLFRKMAESSQGYACAREAERLSALSDAELARLGISRDRIFQHAFGRFMAN